MQDDNLPATTPLAAAAASSSAEPMSTAPVSPDTFRTSPASPANEGDDSPTPNDVAATTGEARSSTPVPTSSVLVYDTKSVIPSATVASNPMS
ncbi:MAG: hypothetical protein L6R38_007369, partial [Xanthoria sp. 2 TBL-2021]